MPTTTDLQEGGGRAGPDPSRGRPIHLSADSPTVCRQLLSSGGELSQGVYDDLLVSHKWLSEEMMNYLET
jgi:hypothetical protein